MSLSLIEERYLFFFDHRYHNATFRYSGAPAPLEKVSVVEIWLLQFYTGVKLHYNNV